MVLIHELVVICRVNDSNPGGRTLKGMRLIILRVFLVVNGKEKESLGTFLLNKVTELSDTYSATFDAIDHLGQLRFECLVAEDMTRLTCG